MKVLPGRGMEKNPDRFPSSGTAGAPSFASSSRKDL